LLHYDLLKYRTDIFTTITTIIIIIIIVVIIIIIVLLDLFKMEIFRSLCFGVDGSLLFLFIHSQNNVFKKNNLTLKIDSSA